MDLRMDQRDRQNGVLCATFIAATVGGTRAFHHAVRLLCISILLHRIEASDA